MVRQKIIVFVLLLILTPTCLSLAAPAQRQDSTRRLYDRVMDEFKHRDYAAAMAGFQLFLELHSQSSLASNARYWIGECQYRMGRYRDALQSFYDVVSNYPVSHKLAASTLKLGQTYNKLGDPEKARLMFDRVVEQHPDSAEAEVALKALEAMTPTDETNDSSE
ncbi:MAG: tol-pal system protein YbgF [Nitrospira sp.]|nr:tol-pal system protein YbgF [Nitrospira sp.]MBX3333282.1 tol-pal system protein YbgF [Nitrospira sp.]MDR4465091.1 tol-pal system protein YbgF [Nitrospira sp.]MDR4468564.1 tol-pal system protein YbgF [Nitrospira sp.]